MTTRAATSMHSEDHTPQPHAADLTPSDSNLSIATLRGRSNRDSISISLKSPRPDGTFFTELSNVDQDAINLETARKAFSDGLEDASELREALGAVLAITDKLVCARQYQCTRHLTRTLPIRMSPSRYYVLHTANSRPRIFNFNKPRPN